MVKIIADTTSCLSPVQAEKLGVYYLPQIIVFGEETYRDDTEMDPRTFLKRQKISPVVPKTAAPPPALYTPIFQELAGQGETMIVLCPSADVSGTFRSATVAAQEFPDADIRILDTRLVAGGLGAVVKQAVGWANEGLSPEQVIANIHEMCPRERVYFLVDTLEYLHKGGRIGTARALLGSLLQMKPILTFRNGLIQPFDSQRTHRRAMARLKEVILADCPRDPEAFLCIMHGDAEEEAMQTAGELSAGLGIPQADIAIYDLTPAILVHSGPGVIGISYYAQPGQE
jgi:DegV family protein with EDD domain